jgi:hypothetical protein
MNGLTDAKVLKGERILFNAVKDIYFTSEMKVEKLRRLLNQAFKEKLINFNICGFIPVTIALSDHLLVCQDTRQNV